MSSSPRASRQTALSLKQSLSSSVYRLHVQQGVHSPECYVKIVTQHLTTSTALVEICKTFPFGNADYATRVAYACRALVRALSTLLRSFSFDKAFAI